MLLKLLTAVRHKLFQKFLSRQIVMRKLSGSSFTALYKKECLNESSFLTICHLSCDNNLVDYPEIFIFVQNLITYLINYEKINFYPATYLVCVGFL